MPIAARAWLGHRGQLLPIAPDIGDLVGHDEGMLGIDRALHVVTDDAAAPCLHRTGIRVGQGNLLVGRLVELHLDLLERLHLRLQGRDLVPEWFGLGFGNIRFLSVGRVERNQVAIDARFNLFHPPLQLGDC